MMQYTERERGWDVWMGKKMFATGEEGKKQLLLNVNTMCNKTP
jgi:hypothetical protein